MVLLAVHIVAGLTCVVTGTVVGARLESAAVAGTLSGPATVVGGDVTGAPGAGRPVPVESGDGVDVEVGVEVDVEVEED